MPEQITIPKTMSTQHPDNVQIPFFSENSCLGGEDEVLEAYYAYSHLNCREQMWDCEGKEVDNFVVKKLLSKYGGYLSNHQLGKDIFLTLRVPNPDVEKAEAKILLETLESIPRSYDVANIFYGTENPPIFEVILPMTISYESLDNIYQYYCDFVVGKQNQRLGGRDLTVSDWIGEFKPAKINIIPLFENKEGMLNSDRIVAKYLENKNLDYQRVFLARSDPAINYGNVGAVLLNKIALMKLSNLSDKKEIPIYPILGVGSAPFRGNLRPDNTERVMKEYPGVWTFTIQSAFKYDYPPDMVCDAVKRLENREVFKAPDVDEKRCLLIFEKCSKEYHKRLSELSPAINKISGFVPKRRMRKLHIGLFGYSRSHEGLNLPRAITFTAACYSLGVPPEILGISALNDHDLDYLRNIYVNFDADLIDSIRYMNPDSPYLPPADLEFAKENCDFEINTVHKKSTDDIIRLSGENRTDEAGSYILKAASERKFLG
ncbi:phosphoenolpyruvate carboxylase [Methanoplanus sp. FWC-SCC4]|uniref:Phosphoenolpyruvate carboxylase n=2 Tax=Methanochimaera problematica TaxID=2609417 RepID=A0AA97FE74_9EURY|nr:phosphoenolpyruvate carboxylase [Methanoplanus sp. FWC-SCC4]